MKATHSSIYYPKKYTHEIGDSMKVEVQIDANPLGLSLETMYEMAARINKKRSFLFVSKVLGKHIPLRPHVPLLASALLAACYYEEKTATQVAGKGVLVDALMDTSEGKLKKAYSIVQSWHFGLGEPGVFIGFAETATALGHGVFDCFSDAVYIHSTREVLVDQEVTLFFEEEHSHATDQRCYVPEQYLANEHTICLVDDEITTGKTALNIIESIQKHFPRKNYVVLSLLDWRSEEDCRKLKVFEQTHGVSIQTFSLLSGTIQVEGIPDLPSATKIEVPAEKVNYHTINLSSFPAPFENKSYVSVDALGILNNAPYSPLTGRFGLTSAANERVENYCEQIGSHLQTLRKGKNTLCLGTGEFMHIPMKVAVYMGESVSFHSTTRSPIFPMDQEGYPIRSCFSFESPENLAIMNYAYNITEKEYDEVFLLFERHIEAGRLEPMLQQFSRIPVIHIVFFS
ncbi:phosphoribosyltransferase family protein [Sporosarcina sp.]|uniref:phosphoribosyltransferase family protein n=1 Tax=Sporosarcina sp. TaxID=49982 RepID=UPI002610CE26|nr:phosphoribosyltransferase family protein [Sporosarcina sp.]